ncbi:hypothetical protein MAR_037354 [Mya arenaria]|uniref:Uncharacterized protein n=1 Tax=Mya arenaria TaxID=6604 RepID=A0ABY7FNP7_MYAAR|nr:hypothetical protein MAR_037354 [Mya arenaria]
MVDAEKGSDVPKELRGKLSAFDSALSDVENKFEPLLKMSKVEINTEDRIRGYMNRVKEVQDKEKAPKLNAARQIPWKLRALRLAGEKESPEVMMDRVKKRRRQINT